jgi:hypothetical protein
MEYYLVAWLDLALGTDPSDEQAIGRVRPVVEAMGAFGPTAAYLLALGGVAMSELRQRLSRLEWPVSLRSPDTMVITRLSELRPLFSENGARAVLRQAVDEGARARDSYNALYLGFSPVVGPEENLGDRFGAAVQLGTFSMDDHEADWDLAQWYEETRLPAIERSPGAHRAQRLVALTGVTKFGVLYEFTSLEARERYFEQREEKNSLDASHATGRVVSRTVHAPWSPSVGRRLLPEARENTGPVAAVETPD